MFTLRTKRTISFSSTFIFLLLLSSLVSAQNPNNPIVSTNINNLFIESPTIPYIEAGREHRFHAHVINATKTKTNLTTQCQLHVYDFTGYDLNISPNMEFETYNGVDFAKTVNGGNFTNPGLYAYVIHCNSSNEVGFYMNNFEVTSSGDDSWFDFTSLMMIFLIGSYAIVFISWNKDEHIPMLLGGLFITIFSILAINNSLGTLDIDGNSFYLIITYFNLALGIFFSLGAGFKLMKEGL